jgi:hypothetical protein
MRVLGKKPSAAHQNLSRLRGEHRELVIRIAGAHDKAIEAGEPSQFHAAGPVAIGPRAKLANRLTPLNYLSSVSQFSTTIVDDAIIAARSRSWREPANELRRRDDLSRVPRGMFCRVKHQSDNGRRQLLPANEPRMKKRGVRSGCELIERLRHHLPPRDKEIGKRGPLGRERLLACQGSSLRLGQRFTSRIREQTIRAAGQMREMKSNRSDSAGLPPQLFDGETRSRSLDVLARHDERMRRRLKKRRNFWNRPTQPGLGKIRRHITPSGSTARI